MLRSGPPMVLVCMDRSLRHHNAGSTLADAVRNCSIHSCTRTMPIWI
jgi:hypothetical protein